MTTSRPRVARPARSSRGDDRSVALDYNEDKFAEMVLYVADRLVDDNAGGRRS